MYQGPWNDRLSFDHDQCINEKFSHTTMDIKQERTNYVNMNTAIHSNFTITEVTDSAFDRVTDRDEEDPLDIMTGQCRSQLPTKRNIKEEVIISDAYGDISETNKDNTETSNTTANRSENWQHNTGLQLESDALNVIQKEKIWRTFTDPSINRKRHFQFDSSFEKIPKIESDDEIAKTDENQPTIKRHKETLPNWRREKTFASEDDALAAVKSEQMWARNKISYRCRHRQCAAGVHLLYSSDATVTMYRSANEHTCDIVESENCDIPDVIATASHKEDTMNDFRENIYGPVEEASTVGTNWDRRFNSKEDIDLAATYDLDLKIVLRKYEMSPVLSPCDQMTICKSIVKCYLYENHDRKFGIKDFTRMATVIVQRFPNEAEETYYTKTKKTRARGKLYDQFQHFRGLLISVGLATKRRKIPGSLRETDEESGSET